MCLNVPASKPWVPPLVSGPDDTEWNWCERERLREKGAPALQGLY